MARHVDLKRDIVVHLMKFVNGIHDVVLTDVAMGSLSASHKVGFQAQDGWPIGGEALASGEEVVDLDALAGHGPRRATKQRNTRKLLT